MLFLFGWLVLAGYLLNEGNTFWAIWCSGAVWS